MADDRSVSTPLNGDDDDMCPWRKSFRINHSALIQRWKDGGIFKDSDLDDINCHWLQFEPAPLVNHLALAFIFFIVFVVGLSSNSVVVYIISTSRHLRTPANILITNLAVSDFLMLLKLPIFIFNSLVQGPALGHQGCVVYGFVSGLSGCASIMSLVAVAIERYLVISRPLRVAKKPTRCWAYISCLLIWLYSIIFSVLPLIGVGKYVPEGYLTSCSFDYLTEDVITRIFILVFFVAAWVCPLTIIIFCYVAIVRYVNQARKDLQTEDAARQSLNCWRFCSKTELTIAKITIGLMAMWLTSWTPYAFVALMGISGNQSRLSPGLTMLPALFAKLSASVNPFIYSLSHPKIRKELARRCQCLLTTATRSSSERNQLNHPPMDGAIDGERLASQQQHNSVAGIAGSPIIHFKSRWTPSRSGEGTDSVHNPSANNGEALLEPGPNLIDKPKGRYDNKTRHDANGHPSTCAEAGQGHQRIESSGRWSRSKRSTTSTSSPSGIGRNHRDYEMTVLLGLSANSSSIPYADASENAV